MAESLELQDALKSMKCYLCKKVLSVPPITVLSEDGMQLKCGRCKNIQIPSRARNFSLENIVKFFSFPCIYEDCNEMIPWKEVENHEDICEKKTIKCLFLDCEDNVQVQNLKKHMEENHIISMYFGYLTRTVKQNHAVLSYVVSNNQQFFVMICNISTPEVYVASLNNINANFTYNLKLSSIISEHSFSISIENQSINKYDERDHCFKCIIKTCDLVHHPHSRVNGNVPVNLNCTKIENLTQIKPYLFGGDISEMKYTIEIHPKKGFEENNKELLDENSTVKSRTNNLTVVEQYVDLLRKQLQCPICMEYMVGNIYNCQKGHVVCDLCKIQLTVCPSCRTKIGESRNFPMEEIADEVVLSCLFTENGCEFTGKLGALSQHEANCVHILGRK